MAEQLLPPCEWQAHDRIGMNDLRVRDTRTGAVESVTACAHCTNDIQQSDRYEVVE